jgi:hypothetical protein
MKKACFSRTSVYKNFKNHFYPDPTRFPGPQTKYCPGKDLNHFRHGNLTPERGIKCRNKSTESTKSAFMSDIMAKTMVAGFKRLPQRAYPGGYTSCFGSRTHFQLATFYALTETPEIALPQPIWVDRQQLLGGAVGCCIRGLRGSVGLRGSDLMTPEEVKYSATLGSLARVPEGAVER